MRSVDYAPGEIVTKMMNAKKISPEPSDLDIILYIEYILYALKLDNHPRISINEGVISVGKFTHPYDMVFVEKANGDTLFFAERLEGVWSVDLSTDGRWRMLLEFAFDKVRSCRDSVDRWITEFPPIGIIDSGQDTGGE